MNQLEAVSFPVKGTNNECGVSEFLQIQIKVCGMDISDARKLRGLQDENAKLKKLLAEQMLPSQRCSASPIGQWVQSEMLWLMFVKSTV